MNFNCLEDIDKVCNLSVSQKGTPILMLYKSTSTVDKYYIYDLIVGSNLKKYYVYEISNENLKKFVKNKSNKHLKPKKETPIHIVSSFSNEIHDIKLFNKSFEGHLSYKDDFDCENLDFFNKIT